MQTGVQTRFQIVLCTILTAIFTMYYFMRPLVYLVHTTMYCVLKENELKTESLLQIILTIVSWLQQKKEAVDVKQAMLPS